MSTNNSMIPSRLPLRWAQLSLVAVALAWGAGARAQMNAHQHGAAVQSVAPMSHTAAAASGAELRDPHAYAGGYQIGVGEYAPTPQRMLHLADEHRFGGVLVDSLERTKSGSENATAFDVQAWWGGDYQRWLLASEGQVVDGRLDEASTHLWWRRASTATWNTQFGLRMDSNGGPDRQWLGVGLEGLAPYWFEIEANAYLGTHGRTALRFKAENEWLLTQRWLVQAHTEWNLYGQSDVANGLGSGLADASVGLRLRYDVSRQLSPYVGVDWTHRFGQTADLARANDQGVHETTWRAGIRFWF